MRGVLFHSEEKHLYGANRANEIRDRNATDLDTKNCKEQQKSVPSWWSKNEGVIETEHGRSVDNREPRSSGWLPCGAGLPLPVFCVSQVTSANGCVLQPTLTCTIYYMCPSDLYRV